MLYCIVSSSVVSCCFVLHWIGLDLVECVVMTCIVLSCIVLSCIVLYCIVLGRLEL